MTDSQDSQPTEALSRRELREARALEESASAAGSRGAKAGASGGLAGHIRRHPTAWLAASLSVAFLLLGTGAVFLGASTGTRATVAAPVPTPTETPRQVPASIPAASHLRTCSVASILADPRLSNFSGYVVNANTGEVLLDRGGTTPQRTGSVLKTLTAAAALQTLGPGGQFTTQVLDGDTPGVIVLKGGGDPTLATTPATVYSGAPLISDLATSAMARYQQLHPGVPVTQIVLDSTMWDPNDKWDDSWLRKEQADGYQAEVTALMVDGGRADPSATVSVRSSDPVGGAGRAFASAAGLRTATFTTGTATGTTVLAEVSSQPISVLIPQMMSWSDNVLAENMARVTSIAAGFDGSSGSLAQAIPGALVALGLDASGVTIRDGSGLSDLNAVPGSFITSLMSKARTGEQNLGIMFNALPVSGMSGTLSGRFTGANAIAAGSVIAKTGWIDTAYTLGGVVNAADGTPLAFMFASIRDGISSDAKEAQDTLATGLYTCGDNLSNT
ncbi:D-alanyl-D-alanine carboxypeptidase/D-alanyl-D-alanine-endopeptidase (penicillin-binding protein 4) [Leifsonia sp. AK011]|uniref:D-alanyl-D-alanine carboxypeptidase/D-alanyl-D-alanine-endopeptidase n=1 Tax=Leifsonia sp. AK011 TaxID=2723075 RepID=UPI0017CC85E5|nr:D-alanyl-D-alanine carboxypeptidase [Leifsonia sp. AK011]NYF11629.1 D-alanyl-D-alanine carboxypeptidase/D-alanyl-D-alanine-endopeptidase (penicillin-binding protein 4) [Leifsonia sp. AK011]